MKYFKEDMNSNEIYIEYLKLFDNLGRHNIAEIKLLDAAYQIVKKTIIDREIKMAEEGWMTSY